MLEKGKISYNQIMGLTIMAISPTAILYVPTMIYRAAKQDGWLSVVLVTILSLITTYIITGLGLMFKNKTIIQYSEMVMGNIIGKIFGFLLCLYFFEKSTIIIREFAELLAGAFLPETPLTFFIIVIILPSIYAVRYGLEVIARVNDIVFPIFLITITTVLILSFKDMDFKKLLPVLSDGIMPVIKGAYPQMIWFSEIVLISMFIPYINIKDKVRQKSILGIIFLGILAMIVNIGIIAVYGRVTGDLIYPFLSIARYVSVGGFIERLDSLIISMWILGVFIKIAVFHYCTSIGFAQLFKLRDYKFLVMPIGTIMSLFSIIQWNNIMELTQQLATTLVVPLVIIQVGIPAIIFCIAKLKRGLVK